MKKYELTTETTVVYGLTLYRIRALISFGDVYAGELGGWIEKESNLDQSGIAWIVTVTVLSGAARRSCVRR